MKALDYRGEISAEEEPFDVPGYLQQALWGFVKLGYSLKGPYGFKLSERTATRTIAEYFLPKEGDCFRTPDKVTANTLAEEMWDALPIWQRNVMAGWITGKSELDLFPRPLIDRL